MCAATGTWAGAGREKEPGLFSVRRNLSLPHSAALPTTQHLAAAHLPPHHGGGGFLLWPLLSSDSSSCASQPGSGEGLRPGVVVSPGPLSRCSRGGGRGWSQGGRQGKAQFWVPRATSFIQQMFIGYPLCAQQVLSLRHAVSKKYSVLFLIKLTIQRRNK